MVLLFSFEREGFVECVVSSITQSSGQIAGAPSHLCTQNLRQKNINMQSNQGYQSLFIRLSLSFLITYMIPTEWLWNFCGEECESCSWKRQNHVETAVGWTRLNNCSDMVFGVRLHPRVYSFEQDLPLPFTSPSFDYFFGRYIGVISFDEMGFHENGGFGM